MPEKQFFLWVASSHVRRFCLTPLPEDIISKGVNLCHLCHLKNVKMRLLSWLNVGLSSIQHQGVSVWNISKGSSYFHRHTVFSSRTFFLELRNHTGFDIISNADEEAGFPIPQGLHKMGLLSQKEYDHLLVRWSVSVPGRFTIFECRVMRKP